MLQRTILFLLCLALLLGLLALAAQRHEALQRARAERFSALVPGSRFRGCICRLPMSSPAARQLLRRIFGHAYIRVVP